MMLKTVIPTFSGNFYLYMCTKYVGYKCGLINATEILTDDEDEDDSEGKQKIE